MKSLEEKITAKVLKNLDKIIEEKCKIVFGKLERDVELNHTNETKESNVEMLKSKMEDMQGEIKSLRDGADEILGSISYISSEYDDFSAKFNKMLGEFQKLAREDEHNQGRLEEVEKHLDQLEQYGRRENLEIHGVPQMRNENTKHIVKSIAKCLNVNLNDSHISTSHRLVQNHKLIPEIRQDKNPNSDFNYRQPQPIIVRFSNRDMKNELFRNRKLLQFNQELKALFGSTSKITFNENLTDQRRRLFNTAKLAKRELNYQFLWTTQGQIRLRKNSESRTINIRSLSDLNKIGYSGAVERSRPQIAF